MSASVAPGFDGLLTEVLPNPSEGTGAIIAARC
jgi:hypothetical protein